MVLIKRARRVLFRNKFNAFVSCHLFCFWDTFILRQPCDVMQIQTTRLFWETCPIPDHVTLRLERLNWVSSQVPRNARISSTGAHYERHFQMNLMRTAELTFNAHQG